jgi:hypothetical protein
MSSTKHHCERDHWVRRASAKPAGGAPHHQRHITSQPTMQASAPFRPSRALLSLVTMIKADIHNLNAAMAALRSARGQETTDDAGVAPSQPAFPSLSGSPGATLPTIPEDETTLFEEIPDAPDGRTAHHAPAWDHCESDSDLSLAETPVAGARTANKDRNREGPRSAARGRLTIKSTADHRRSIRAVCSVEHRMLTLSIDPRDVSSEGSQGTSAVVVEVPVEELAVRCQQGRADMFTIATLHEQKMYDEICCFADDQAERDEWIAVFRRMGVAVFHCGESESSADAASGAPACTLISPPVLARSAHQTDTGCFDDQRHAWRQTSNFHKAFRTFNPES